MGLCPRGQLAAGCFADHVLDRGGAPDQFVMACHILVPAAAGYILAALALSTAQLPALTTLQASLAPLIRGRPSPAVIFPSECSVSIDKLTM